MLAGGSCSPLRGFLEQHGCRCSFAKSTSAALSDFRHGSFHLILGLDTILNGWSHRFASLAPRTSVYSLVFPLKSVLVVANRASEEECFGAPALRPNEFTQMLDTMSRQAVLPSRVCMTAASAAAE
jgi:hypothetical protein